jgi:hypothetical protein
MRWAWTAAVLILAACETTMVSVWKKSGQGPLAFSRVAVIAPVTDEGMRRAMEDQIAASIRNVEAVPSYRLGLTDLTNRENVRQALVHGGCDGAITVAITAVEKDVEWTPGPAGPYGAWGAWPVYDPGYYYIDTNVRVRTNIYSLPDGELLFSATSRTSNPPNVRNLVSETVNAVSQELQKQGLAAPPPKPVSLREGAVP